MRQTELQLEEQVKEAKRKIKPVNNELREIVSFLLDAKEPELERYSVNILTNQRLKS